MLSVFGLTCKGWLWPWPWQRSETVLDRLHRSSILSARPICEISGVAGILGIGSLTKAFTAVVITNLLEDHPNITLDTVDGILPDYVPLDDRLRNQVSLGDFLSHRSGLLGDMSFAVQGQFECLLPKDQLLPTVSRWKTIAPIRRQWSYNNWGYGIAGAVIEKLSGKSFAAYLKESILDPLGLKHITSQPNFGPQDNFASPHIALCDGTPLPVNSTYFFKDTFFEPAGGLYSNVDDMLTWAKAVLQAESGSRSGPLRNIPTVISNQIPLDHLSHDFRFYGMGWIQTQLPGVVGLQGDNPELFPIQDLPLLGAGGSPMMVYYHQGSAPGYYSALLLFPETESAIVVLTNSIPLNDAADWISQAYHASALFHFPEPADYKHPADRPKLPLSSYVGVYQNDAGNFFIDISEHDGSSNETSLLLRF
ncbi:beta-lactamase/transpeptidase-like protein [Podospora aff. communis PSN243]|uniref:Beta-lactamase/transpeptidase-like protein n=1 Tax=Podospora aff. communis PSN243 TaxID=3040156 RepID=A0AAV9G8L5_9PEZI|nr:beta-lactamase/transpeptidase-like protein [Podospora aff. communis PSN243]